MEIYISEDERKNARGTALKSITKFFKIPRWDEKSEDELLNAISALKHKNGIEIARLLTIYFQAYDEWFQFVIKLKQKSDINEGENSELIKLLENKEVSLNNLQEKFEELQLSEFTRNVFGKEIKGQIYKQNNEKNAHPFC